MAKILTRAEKYKRNYRLINNAYHNPTLSKKAQSWSDERLYKALGIKVTKSTPKLKTRPKNKQAYYNRKFDKFVFARQLGLSVKEAKRQTKYKDTKIELNARYIIADRLRIKNKKIALEPDKVRAENDDLKRIELSRFNRRRALWSDFMKDKTSMPPEIVARAKAINSKTRIGGRRDPKTGKMIEGKQLDPHDKYGYVVQHYMFVENLSQSEIDILVKPDQNDALAVVYATTIRAI